jgi:GT2 family glycosyltransferase
MTKVLIAIPTYNGYMRLDWLLNSMWLKCSDEDKKILQDSKIVVCDDSGREEHRNKVRSVVHKWKNDLPVDLIINEKNVGVPSSWNRLTKSCDSQYVIIINDDIIVSKDWLTNLVYFLDNNPMAGGVSPFCNVINEGDVPELLSSQDAVVKPRNPDTRNQTDDFDSTYSQVSLPQRCMAALGCLFGFRRDMYNMVGGFDGSYFAFCDESDFGTALAQHGYPSYVIGCPRCWHIWSATFGTAPEINTSNVFANSKEYYTKKWNGFFEVTHPRMMSKIPFMKVKWICKGKEYEAVVESEYGCRI